MSNQVMPFEFDGSGVRVVEGQDGTPMFVAKDVALALDYKWNGNSRISHVPSEWKGVTTVVTPGGSQQLQALTEEGLYFFVNRSDKPKAIPFQKWISGEVLPSIRTHGGYVQGQEELSESEFLAKALVMSQSILDEKRGIIEQQKKKIEEDAPRVGFYEAVTQSASTYDMAQVAKTLGVMGRNTLIDYLRQKKIFRPVKGSEPYQQYVTSKHFKLVSVERYGNTYYKTVAHQKGIDLIYRLFRDDGLIA